MVNVAKTYDITKLMDNSDRPYFIDSEPTLIVPLGLPCMNGYCEGMLFDTFEDYDIFMTTKNLFVAYDLNTEEATLFIIYSFTDEEGYTFEMEFEECADICLSDNSKKYLQREAESAEIM